MLPTPDTNGGAHPEYFPLLARQQRQTDGRIQLHACLNARVNLLTLVHSWAAIEASCIAVDGAALDS